MAWWKQPPSVEGLYRKPYIIVTTIGFFFSTRRPNGRCSSPFLIFPAVFLRSTCGEARSSGRLLMAGCPHLWTFFFHFQRIFVKEMDTAGQPDPSLFERSTLSLFFRSRFFLCWRNGRPVRMSSSFFFIDLFLSFKPPRNETFLAISVVHRTFYHTPISAATKNYLHWTDLFQFKYPECSLKMSATGILKFK